MTLGEKIQILRKQQGMSQEQLAEKMHISRQAISRWELNESMPDVENLIKLSNLFDVTVDYLVKDSDFLRKEEGDDFLEWMNDSKPKNPSKGGLLDVLSKVLTFCTTASVGIYLLLGFFGGWWHPGWLIFVIPGMLLTGIRAIKH